MTDGCKRCGHGPLEHRREPSADPSERFSIYPCRVAYCACSDMVHANETLWRVIVAALDETDASEIFEISSRLATVWIEPAGGVVVETNPAAFGGGFLDQRIVPWSRLLDFRKQGPE